MAHDLLRGNAPMLKRAFHKIDDVLFGSALERYRRYRQMNELETGFDHRFFVFYEKNPRDMLSNLCDKYGSDKGAVKTAGHPYWWPAQTYADFYSRLFSHCRGSVQKVFECGLGTNNPDLPSNMGVAGKPGASLRVWRDFFPNATIYGADIDRDILFQEDRIKTHYLDQLAPKTIAAFWEQVGIDDCDFMVDDGLHTFEAGICLFEHSISHLAKHGIYTIEDVVLRNLLRFKEYFRGKDFAVDYVTMFRPNRKFPGDNSLVVVRKM
jgi:hypothetical protein